jgi:hypothetical protein
LTDRYRKNDLVLVEWLFRTDVSILQAGNIGLSQSTVITGYIIVMVVSLIMQSRAIHVGNIFLFETDQLCSYDITVLSSVMQALLGTVMWRRLA